MRGGTLEIICGCMFSGKTTRLLQRIAALTGQGARVVAIKPAIDDRYSATAIVTHDGSACPASTVRDAAQITALAADADVVAIDEIHFFGVALVPLCRELVAGGRHVIGCGLDRDMWGVPFDAVARLIDSATAVARQHGACARCGGAATHTQRTAPIIDGNLVGGAEAFEPRCARCFRPPPEPRPVAAAPGLAP